MRKIKTYKSLLVSLLLYFASALIYLLQGCGGKVADLSASQASTSGVTIISKTLPGIQVGVVQTGVSTAGGVLPLVFSISDGDLPPGLIIDPLSGQISGTIPPAAANQTYTPTIKVTDAAGLSDLRTFTSKVDPGDALLNIVSTELSAITAGVPFSYPVAVVGGTTPYNFTIASGALPLGLSLDASTGVISGTAAISAGGQSYVFVLKVSDSASQVQTISFVGQIASNPVGAIQIVSTSIPGVGVGSISTGISTAGGLLPLNFTISSGSLPPGLAINSATGAITGTIPVSAANSSYGFSVTVADSGGSSATRSFTGTISPGSSILTLLTTNLSTIAAGISYSFPLAAVGGTPPYSFTVATGALPSGLAIDSTTGVVSGTPGITTGGQAYSVGIKLTDASSQSQTNSFLGTVAANPVGSIEIVSTTVPGMTVGAVSTGISTRGGVAPLVFSLSSGTLPSGLTLNSATGALTGTIPISAGNTNYGFSIAVGDAAGAVASKSFSGTVSPGTALLSLVTTTLSPVTAGIIYSFPIAVSGGLKPYSFAISSGTLPLGLSLADSTGVISGTPSITSGGQAYSFTLRVSDAASQSQTASFVGTIAANPVGAVQIVSTNIPGIAVGTVSTGVSTSGGVPPLAFSISNGALPTGLSMSAMTGAITGTVPISQGNTNYGFSVNVTDATGVTASRSFTGTVNAGSSVLSTLSTQLSPVTAGVPFSFPITVSGGSAPYGFAVSTGSLPPGLTINPTSGIISGTPAVTSGGQVYSFTIRIADSGSQTVTQQFIGTIATNPVGNVQIVSNSVPGLSVGPVSTGISTAGGITPLSFAVSSGALPSGLSLNSVTGAISGTIPIVAANSTYGFSITVTDASGAFAVKSFTGTVNAGTSLLGINSNSLAQFIAGVSYSYPLVATGGVSPYTFTISTGSLPMGISLNPSSGTLSGTPSVSTVGQSFAFTVTASDTTGQTANKTYTTTVASSTAASLVIASQTIPAPSAGSPYVASVSVTGGTPPYNYAITSGSLPNGLTLSSAGIITGTPAYATKGSAYLFTIQVTDSTSLSASVSYQGFVGGYLPSISPSALPAATPSANYTAFISTSGGQSPYIYSLTSGALPSGLILNSSTGVISGTVDESESGNTRNFSIKSVDANGVIATTAYSLTVNNFSIQINNSTLAIAIEGSTYSNNSISLTATGGTPPYSFQYTGSLPSGLGLTSSGTFFGTPATNSGALSPGSDYTVYVRARDAQNNLSATVPFTLTTLVSAPSVTATSPTSAVLGSPYTFTLGASGGRAPYSFAITAGVLPDGLTLSSSGTISGIASTARTCPTGQFTIRVTDSLSQLSAGSLKCIETKNGILISNTLLPMVSTGVLYSAQINAAGGTPPYSYSAIGLPIGITINSSTGALTGYTNASAGDYSSYITVNDSSSPTSLANTRAFNVAVRNQLTLNSSSMPRAATGIAYNNGSGVQLNAVGGYSPYTYTLASGSLPSGLSLTSAGLIQGIPDFTTANFGGQHNFSVVATDFLGNQTTPASFVIYVTRPPKIVDSKLPFALIGTPYAYDIKRTGGVNQFNGTSSATLLSYSVQVTSPPNTTLSDMGLAYSATTGRIYGTPVISGIFTLAVAVTDQHGFTANKNMILTVNTQAKNLDLKTVHWSDPCTGQSNCWPESYDIAQITNNSQQFIVYQRRDTSPISVQIAKIDPTGRIPNAGANVTSINVALPANIQPTAWNFKLGYIKIADIDQDTFKDIVFSDVNNRQICVLWNSGTVDTFGMPNGFSSSNSSCFPISFGLSTSNFLHSFVIKNDLRPDSTNIGKQDIIVPLASNFNSNAPTTIFTLLNSCSPTPGNCSANRHSIFPGFNSQLATLNSTTTITLTDTSGALPGAPIVGVGIQVGTTISSVVQNTSITLSAPATTTASNIRVVWSTANPLTGSATNNNASITNVASLGSPAIKVGDIVLGAGIQSGTAITAITGTGPYTVTLNRVFTGATGSTTFGALNLVHHTPALYTAANRSIGAVSTVDTGWFNAAKPELPSGVDGVEKCPAIIIAGVDNGANTNSYAYVIRQSFASGMCLGDFTKHDTSGTSGDEMFLTGNSPYVSSLAVSDFNNDGWSDFAVGYGNTFTNSASIQVYTNGASGLSIRGGTKTSTQLQSRGTDFAAASKVIPYCIDGSNSCAYPALVATCGREFFWGWINNNWPAWTPKYACLSVIPNQCTSSGCSTPFESSTPTARIDYPAPHGQNQTLLALPLVSTSYVYPTATTASGSKVITVSSTADISVGQPVSGTNIPSYAFVTAVDTAASTITINQNALASSPAYAVQLKVPVVPTRNDIAFAGNDGSTSNPYFVVYARNGSSVIDPFKGATMLDAFPSAFLMSADLSSTRFADINNDGLMDVFAFSPNQSFIGSYVSSTSGGTSYSVSGGVEPNYLANPSLGGCPVGATKCFPDPYFNSIGVQQNYPNGIPHQNIIDVADLNGDEIPDLIANGYFSRGIAITLGTGSGDLATPMLYELGVGQDIRPRALSISDLDQDGIPDVAVIGINLTGIQSPVAAWLKGNGDGSFGSPERIDFILNGCADPRSIQAFDIDQDGRPELATLCYANQDIRISRRNSDGNWILQTGSSINTAGGANGTALKFGRLTTSSATGVDVVVGGLDANSSMRILSGITLSVTNPSTGAFSLAVTNLGAYIRLNGYVGDLDIGDLNADGSGDVVISLARQAGTINIAQSFFSCTSTVHGFCAPMMWGSDGYDPTSISAADINNDGLADVFQAFKTDRIIFRTLSRVLNLSQ